MSKQNTSNLGIRTPEKRYRKHLPASDNVDMATNVSKEFVAVAKGMKKGCKQKKKYETIIKTDQEKNMKSPQEIKCGFLLPPVRGYLKLLLVFSNSDAVTETLQTAAKQLSFDVTQCNTYNTALEEFQSKSHDLIIIDTRFPRSLEFEMLCRSIRSTKGSMHSIIVALVKKSIFEKDEVTVLSLLDTGFNRCLMESSNVTVCVNELIQLKHSDVRPQAQYTTTQSLYAALDKCRDVVFITDDIYRLQYANKSIEKYLGFRQDETLGKPIQELFLYDNLQLNTMNSYLTKGREWQGQIVVKRKASDPIKTICKAVPVICAGRIPTHYVLVMDFGIFPSSADISSGQGLGSVPSIHRPSTDIRSNGSEYLPRMSLTKLSALPLEAPITKITSLIAQAQDDSGKEEVVSALDKVMDMLRSTELYAIHMKEQQKIKTDEPVASDLIGALLSQQPTPQLAAYSRRSSNDSLLFRPSRSGQLKLKVPAQAKDILENSLSWEFDIFRLEELCHKRPLQHLGMNLFLLFDVPGTLNCDERTLYNWLTIIELNYHATNTYHNSTHAADVMQATACFLEKERMKSIMEPLDEATSLIAAAAHDVDHPGKSSAFLSNSDDPLAILYNDVTVLEMHHASLTFKLTLGDDRINIFKNLDREKYKIARHNVIDMILATEMTKHFEHLAKFVNVFCAKMPGDTEDNSDYVPVALPENITLVKRMMIKCADVSNPSRPLRLCVEWARRIAEEYFQQTDEEKSKGLPVVMPMFDRQTCSIPKSQIGFVDYIINDMFEAWNAFIDMPELITYMRQNYIRWKELDEQGHTTLTDIAILQKSALLSPMFPVKHVTKKKSDKQ